MEDFLFNIAELGTVGAISLILLTQGLREITKLTEAITKLTEKITEKLTTINNKISNIEISIAELKQTQHLIRNQIEKQH